MVDGPFLTLAFAPTFTSSTHAQTRTHSHDLTLLNPNSIPLSHPSIQSPLTLPLPNHHPDPATSVNGGDLYDSLKAAGRLAEDVAKPIFAQLLAAIHYMHKKNVSHRWVNGLCV